MATKNLVPRNSGEGSLGSSSKPWASGYYDKLYITGAAGWTQITGAGCGRCVGDSRSRFFLMERKRQQNLLQYR